jgi:hypothetical protein
MTPKKAGKKIFDVAADGKKRTHTFPVIDGQVLPYTPAKGRLAIRLRALALISDDLRRVRLLVTQAMKISDPTIHDALWTSAVSAYGRCFTSADGRGFKLEERDHLSEFTIEQLEFHAAVMRLRHDYVAHAGRNALETAFVQIALAPRGEHPAIRAVAVGSLRVPAPLGRAALNNLGALASIHFKKIEEMSSRASKALEDEYRTKAVDEVYQSAVYPPDEA